MSDLTADAIDRLQALVEAGQAAEQHPAGGLFVTVPDGYRVEHLRPTDAPLTHIKAAISFDEAKSFCNYINSFKTASSHIFAAIALGKMTAVLDYHGKDVTAHCAHRAIYTLPHSEQWKRWIGIDGKLIDQRAFAEFIEENILDVVEPDGATLLEIATSLQNTRKVEFHAGINLGNGTTQLTYVEADDAKTGKQALTIPQKIKLGIPIYFGDEPYGVDCFFRYRIEQGALKFMIRTHLRELLVQDAFQRKAAWIGEQTGIDVLFASA